MDLASIIVLALKASIVLALKASIVLTVFALGLGASPRQASYLLTNVAAESPVLAAVALYLIVSAVLSALYLLWRRHHDRVAASAAGA